MQRTNRFLCGLLIISLLIEIPNVSVAHSSEPALFLFQHTSEASPDGVSLQWFQFARKRLAEKNLILSEVKTAEKFTELSRDLFGGVPSQDLFQLDSYSLRVVESRRAYYQFDFSKCLQILEVAGKKLQQQAEPAYFHPAAIFEGKVLAGVCHLARQDQAAADAAFLDAVGFSSEKALSAMAYSPEVISRFEQARRNWRGKPIKYSLTSEPPFADVTCNGKSLGQTPLTIDSLGPRENFFSFRQADHQTVYRRHLSIDGQGFRIHVVLPAASQPSENLYALRTQGDQDIQPYLEALKTQRLILVQLNPESDLTGFHVLFTEHERAKAQVIRTWEWKGRDVQEWRDNGLPRFLENWFPEAASDEPIAELRELPSAQPQQTPTSESKSVVEFPLETAGQEKLFYEHWWFWPAVALVVAGAAAGAYAAFGSADQSGIPAGPAPGSSSNSGGVVVSLTR